jgi:hypothetical protein
MKVAGHMTKLMELGSTLITMGLLTKGNGIGINNMGKDLKDGLTDRTLMASIEMVRSMVLVPMPGLMVLGTQESGKTMKYQGLVSMNGLMVGSM